MYKISPAIPQDSEDLSLLVEELMSQEADFTGNREIHKRGIEGIISTPALGMILKFEVDGKIAGMINILFSISTAIGAKVAIFEDFSIASEYRSKGYGKALFQEAIKEAKTQGCKRISLITDGDNEFAQRFYRNQGLESSEMIPFRMSI